MKRRDCTVYGQTNNQGTFLMSNKAEMQEYFKQWPGYFFTLKIEVQKTKPLSLPLIAYYKKKVVQDMQYALMQAGERKTAAQTDLWLRELSPITTKEEYNFDAQKWESETIELEQLDNQQLVFFIEHLKEFAAQEYGVYIEDPQTLI